MKSGPPIHATSSPLCPLPFALCPLPFAIGHSPAARSFADACPGHVKRDAGVARYAAAARTSRPHGLVALWAMAHPSSVPRDGGQT